MADNTVRVWERTCEAVGCGDVARAFRPPSLGGVPTAAAPGGAGLSRGSGDGERSFGGTAAGGEALTSALEPELVRGRGAGLSPRWLAPAGRRKPARAAGPVGSTCTPPRHDCPGVGAPAAVAVAVVAGGVEAAPSPVGGGGGACGV